MRRASWQYGDSLLHRLFVSVVGIVGIVGIVGVVGVVGVDQPQAKDKPRASTPFTPSTENHDYLGEGRQAATQSDSR